MMRFWERSTIALALLFACDLAYQGPPADSGREDLPSDTAVDLSPTDSSSDAPQDVATDERVDTCTGQCGSCVMDSDCEPNQVCSPDNECVACTPACGDDNKLVCGRTLIQECDRCEVISGVAQCACIPTCNEDGQLVCGEEILHQCDRCQDDLCQRWVVSNIEAWPTGAPSGAIAPSENEDFWTSGGGAIFCGALSTEEYCVAHVEHVMIPEGVALTVKGTRALILLVEGDVQIETGGRIVLANRVADRRDGAGSDGEGLNGGGGGAFGARGGDGGNSGGLSALGMGGELQPHNWLDPLRGGAPGGDGGNSTSSPTRGVGGRGGGAIQISARGIIRVAGTINANGGGDGPAISGYDGVSSSEADHRGGGGGGGSGGGILLESRTQVELSGNLNARGGNGGDGGSYEDDADNPEGGAGSYQMGNGTSQAGLNGANGMATNMVRGSGGGGGGAGYIVIRADTRPTEVGMIRGVYESTGTRWSNFE